MMAVERVTFYRLICDGCRVLSTEDSEYSAWSDEEGAREDAADGDWVLIDRGDSGDGRPVVDRHYCSNCVTWCPVCEEHLIPKNGDEPCPNCKLAIVSTTITEGES